MKWSEIFRKQQEMAERSAHKFDIELAKSYEACRKRMEDYRKKPLEKSYEAQWVTDEGICREEVSFRPHGALESLYHVESRISLIRDIGREPVMESKKSSLLASYQGFTGRLDSREGSLRWYLLPEMGALLYEDRLYLAMETDIKEETA